MTSPSKNSTDAIPDEVLKAAHEIFVSLPKEGAAIEAIARAIIEAEKRGEDRERERCAKIAEGTSAGFDFAKALADCRDSEHGFHSGRLHAASAIRGGR